MVHADKGRLKESAGGLKQVHRAWERVRWDAGWVCLENSEEHFEPGERPGKPLSKVG
jgi:hypothetical protein